VYDYVPLRAWAYDRSLSPCRLRIGIGNVGGHVKIELIQPGEGATPQASFLQEKGPGLHHVAFYSERYEEWLDRFRQRGAEIGFEAEAEDEINCYRRSFYAELAGTPATVERIVLRFAENGAAVVVADIRGRCAAIVKRFGRIDIWVNNAGISQNLPIDELEGEDWDRVMKGQHGGKIINIASLAGERGGRFAGAHYSAAKAGVIMLTKCFALSGGEHNITVNAIAPGLIETQMAAELGFLRADPADIPLWRLGTPRDVADAVLYLASGLSDYVTGMTIDVNGSMFMR
jgi:NADP-dependent 3-hydroxy acid dehydrogenase YdfG